MLLITVGTAPSKAGFLDGTQFTRLCRVSSDVCLGYIEGVFDAIATNQNLDGLRACFPEDITTGQLRDAILLYAQNNPQMDQYTASHLIAAAFADAFPCK